jgi:hypothetical protein
MQPQHVQDSINMIMSDCFYANESLGSKTGENTKFVTVEALEANNG